MVISWRIEDPSTAPNLIRRHLSADVTLTDFGNLAQELVLNLQILNLSGQLRMGSLEMVKGAPACCLGSRLFAGTSGLFG